MCSLQTKSPDMDDFVHIFEYEYTFVCSPSRLLSEVISRFLKVETRESSGLKANNLLDFS